MHILRNLCCHHGLSLWTSPFIFCLESSNTHILPWPVADIYPNTKPNTLFLIKILRYGQNTIVYHFYYVSQYWPSWPSTTIKDKNKKCEVHVIYIELHLINVLELIWSRFAYLKYFCFERIFLSYEVIRHTFTFRIIPLRKLCIWLYVCNTNTHSYTLLKFEKQYSGSCTCSTFNSLSCKFVKHRNVKV